jgi:hypothetical protein
MRQENSIAIRLEASTTLLAVDHIKTFHASTKDMRYNPINRVSSSLSIIITKEFCHAPQIRQQRCVVFSFI